MKKEDEAKPKTQLYQGFNQGNQGFNQQGFNQQGFNQGNQGFNQGFNQGQNQGFNQGFGNT